MSSALAAATWRERFSQPLVLLVLLILIGSPAALVVIAETPRFRPDATLMMLVVSAGLIGRDVSTGVLPLMFTRPLRRSEYVLTRWLAGSLASCALALIGIAIQVVAFAVRHAALSPVAVGEAIFAQVTLAWGLSAVLVMFSSLVRGIGDLGIWFVCQTSVSLIGFAGGQRVATALQQVLTPTIDWWRTFGSSPVSIHAIASYLSTITACLALAVVVVNHKELSYASA